MGLRERLGIRHPVIDEQGHPHCHNCNTDLTGQQAPPGAGQPVRCPSCRAKNFPDLRGSDFPYRKR
jgi:hypothetical protein